jgi:hypothetical protein
VKYLVNISKSATLSDTVQLRLEYNKPVLVRTYYIMGNGRTLRTMLWIGPGIVQIRTELHSVPLGSEGYLAIRKVIWGFERGLVDSRT